MAFDCSDTNANLKYRGASFAAITGSSLPDLSASGNTGSISGVIADGGTFAGRTSLGKSLAFDGSQSVALADFGVTSAFTLAAWINPNASSGGRIIYRYDTGTGSGYYLSVGDVASQVRFTVFTASNGNDIYSNAGSVPNGTPVFVSARRDTSGVMNLFVNGVKQTATSTQTGAIAGAPPAFLAESVFGGSQYVGSLLMPSVYDISLTDADMADLYNYNGGPSAKPWLYAAKQLQKKRRAA